MSIYQFMSDNPWLSFFLAVIASEFTIRVVTILPNRVLRHWNIRKHGYPPSHCDADGDFKKDKKDNCDE